MTRKEGLSRWRSGKAKAVELFCSLGPNKALMEWLEDTNYEWTECEFFLNMHLTNDIVFGETGKVTKGSNPQIKMH